MWIVSKDRILAYVYLQPEDMNGCTIRKFQLCQSQVAKHEKQGWTGISTYARPERAAFYAQSVVTKKCYGQKMMGMEVCLI